MNIAISTYDEALEYAVSEYQAEGYTILARPSMDMFPEFLPRNCIADIIATRGEKNIITVLRTHEKLQKDRGLLEWTKIIYQQQDWQIDLLVYDVAISKTYIDPIPPRLSLAEAYGKLTQIENQHPKACSEVEVAECLQIAESTLCLFDKNLRTGSASWRLRQAFTDGWLSQNQLHVLQRALEERHEKGKLDSLLGWRELLPMLKELIYTLQDFKALQTATRPTRRGN
jgi:hypothetical protein